jgi:hypothetical protein
MVFETKLPPNAQSSKETDIRRRRCSNLVAADMICDHRHCFNLQIGCVGCFSHTCDLEAEALGLEMERDVFLVELSYRLGAVLGRTGEAHMAVSDADRRWNDSGAAFGRQAALEQRNAVLWAE